MRRHKTAKAELLNNSDIRIIAVLSKSSALYETVLLEKNLISKLMSESQNNSRKLIVSLLVLESNTIATILRNNRIERIIDTSENSFVVSTPPPPPQSPKRISKS